MIIIAVLFLFLLFYKCKFGPNKNYLSLEQTTCVNGLFIILVFFRHLNGYVEFDGILDKPMVSLNSAIFQLLVVSFLFNSGYGIAESIRLKEGYVKLIPIKRILYVWLQFAICVAIYIAIAFLRGENYSANDIALSFTGWTSVGNSTWYIMAILLLWIFTWISFSITRKGVLPYLMVLVLTVGYVLSLKVINKPMYRYDTAILYPLGMLYSYYKEKIEKILSGKVVYWCCLVLSLVVFAGSHHFARKNFFIYEIMVISFGAIIVLVSMNMKIGNKFSFWLGKNLFGLYMLQRIPMILLADSEFILSQRYIYAALCFVLMLLLGWGFNKLYGSCWNRFVLKKK